MNVKKGEVVPPGPCANIRVVDLCTIVAGPFASQFLADLGAEVIKVESAGADILRVATPQHKGISGLFEQHNRGKKSVALDIKSEHGRTVVRKLVSTADVFVQNSRPGVMERLGFGYEDLKKINPRLIYVSICGFGESGPYADRAAYDGVIQGMIGFMPTQGQDGEPQAILSPVADKMTAIWASHAILAALLHRANTGEGQKVVVSMMKAFGAFMLPDQIVNHTFPGADVPQHSQSLSAYSTLPTANGEVIGLVLQRHQFEALVKAFNREDLLDDPRFESNLTIGRYARELYEAIKPQTIKMTTDAFLELANKNGVPFGRVNTVEDFFKDPQAIHSKAYVDFKDPLLGVVRHVAYPAEFEHSPANITRRAPLLGEHTEEILKELGLQNEG